MGVEEISISAPGKVILHGEHAVVYGKAAIAGSLDLRFHLNLKKTRDVSIALALPDIGISQRVELSALQSQFYSMFQSESQREPVPASDDVIAALKNFLHLDKDSHDTKQLAVVAFLYIYCSIFMVKRELPSICVEMKSEIPVGAGLGSSAAFSVALSAALLQLAGVVTSEQISDSLAAWSATDLDIINKWAFIGEKVIHGQPSGIDNSISTYGGALRFQNGEKTRLDRIPTLSLMLVNTQVPRSTKKLISDFRHKYNTYKEIFEPVLSSVEAITEKAQLSLQLFKETSDTSHHDTLGDLMDMNHQFLNLMGVGHSSLDQIVATACDHGFHGKLTGAGGGGCAIILLPSDADAVVLEKMKAKFDSLGFQVFPKTSFGGRGVMQHL
ncbi:mevalonate kinase [Plakobranchus ocellatus]|uniref:Mevalonate kinase n=1 Tax=Plakobranchus ocellatus TaxID=259542 RepID=A0AAV4ALG0_9GAST|nr:mevalonate kinase [Plakobranchus ocellatus]